MADKSLFLEYGAGRPMVVTPWANEAAGELNDDLAGMADEWPGVVHDVKRMARYLQMAYDKGLSDGKEGKDAEDSKT